MERFIHRQNIEHYERLLQTVTEEAERKRILKLLEEEKKENRSGRSIRNKTAGIDSLLCLFVPFPPVCWVHFNPLLGCRAYPPAENTTACEH